MIHTRSASHTLVVLGTRPEAVKLAPVIYALRSVGCDVRVAFTAQHRTLASSVLDYFGIVPDYDLNVMRPSQTSSEILASVAGELGPILRENPPGLLIVQGDTTSGTAAALVAFYNSIPTAHVEAGLRSGVIDNPFPEEMNRRVVSQIARLHFAPTERNKANLLHEGIDPTTIHITGNTVIDALETILADHSKAYLPDVARLALDRGHRILLLTAHRRENFGAGHRGIFEGIGRVIEEHHDLEVIYPMHPNPEIARLAAIHLPYHNRLHRVDALGYPEFIHLLSASWLVATDSGGLQEEAPALGVPTLVLRTTTERPELVACGSGLLVGVTSDAVVKGVRELVADESLYASMATVRYPFGTGGAGQRIAQILAAEQWIDA